MPHEKLLVINPELKQVVRLLSCNLQHVRDILECTSSVNQVSSYGYLARFEVI